ncbi:hypothetical protein, partial [Salmonella enterica]
AVGAGIPHSGGNRFLRRSNAMCIDHVLTFPVPLEDASLLADYCGFEVYPTYSTNRADETPRFSVVALHRHKARLETLAVADTEKSAHAFRDMAEITAAYYLHFRR